MVHSNLIFNILLKAICFVALLYVIFTLKLFLGSNTRIRKIYIVHENRQLVEVN